MSVKSHGEFRVEIKCSNFLHWPVFWPIHDTHYFSSKLLFQKNYTCKKLAKEAEDWAVRWNIECISYPGAIMWSVYHWALERNKIKKNLEDTLLRYILHRLYSPGQAILTIQFENLLYIRRRGMFLDRYELQKIFQLLITLFLRKYRNRMRAVTIWL